MQITAHFMLCLKKSAEANYSPAQSAYIGAQVSITVSDNGNGILKK